ncbi:hypothetical protein DWB61_09650 [Ancylomarina euxinus]|uniref:Uncharacterized protein n=1 Tax=Ancylomarina euxinus TaxID=2283627 RepID=A0A425Y0X6_9BACT|nr:hypothetical protein [Ancylomarina euxinus]MCZ4693808.1 hypothetical protein [Ancylomarina euxinus]MUP15113.1 hypothetical protein [Ancylomarina euxinus]RRG21535.1 hypothetical protein DWB61_09650 [Ancylomarina euxinus]
MRSNLIKFGKPVLTNEIEYDSINTSQKQSLHKMVLDKLSVILNQDIDKGLKLIEQLISKEEMSVFRSELDAKFSSKQTKEYQSVNFNKRLKTLRSCFEGLSADSIL